MNGPELINLKSSLIIPENLHQKNCAVKRPQE